MKNKKSLGQHWLYNRAILDEIAASAYTNDAEVCLEIGPGLGTLTSSLLRIFPRIIAVEYDDDLARKLPGSFPGKNLTVVNQDILQADLPTLVGNVKYCVAGNIPYYITSPIVKKILEATAKPAKISLLMQKEVAQRIAATEGNYSLLGLWVQNQAEVELGILVKAAEFTPPPKVDSQVLILTPRAQNVVDEKCLELAKRGFSSPRKKLAGVLADGKFSKEDWRQMLETNNLNPDARAEDLGLKDWENLAKSAGIL